MRALKFHYGLSWLSAILAFCLVAGETIKNNIQSGGVDLGLDYAVYAFYFIIVMQLAALYYSLFKWNKSMRTGAPTDLFVVIVLLSLVMIFCSVTCTIVMSNSFAPPTANNGFFGELFSDGQLSASIDKLRKIEKWLFFLYATFSVILLVLLFMTLSIREALSKKASPGDKS